MAENPTVGWREWVQLPELGGAWTKAKIDTGARSSTLHALDLERDADGASVVFTIHPRQRSTVGALTVRAPIVDERHIRSSNGEVELRPVIRTMIRVGGVDLDADLTLTDRTDMGFRMLLGRVDLRRIGQVDPGRSYLQGRRRADGTAR